MERTGPAWEEIHVFGNVAERTGTVLATRGIKRSPRGCTSMRDLLRKYKVHGDGMFYLPVGEWPEDQTTVSLENAPWLGFSESLR